MERFALASVSNIVPAFVNALALARNLVRSQGALAAENLFFRKQLTFFVEREQTPHRQRDAVRDGGAGSAVRLGKNALVVVKPDTLVRWHRKGLRLFWRWKSRHKGRPPVPEELKKLIVEMAVTNVSWGEERIAHELLVKLRLRVSPRTVEKYMPSRDDSDRGSSHSSQCWSTFVRNHAKASIATDFLTVVTARVQFLYVLVVMEVGTRKIIHVNVTTHPTAEWTLQQFREAIPCEHDYRFVIFDRTPDCRVDHVWLPAPLRSARIGRHPLLPARAYRAAHP